MVRESITRKDIDTFKKEFLAQSILVKVEEAAQILAVSERTVLRRVEEGRLTPYNDNSNNKGVRFLASELQAYVREMRGHMKNSRINGR